MPKVTAIDARDRKIALSIKALCKSEEREEIESYLQREREEVEHIGDYLDEHTPFRKGERQEPDV